VINATGKFLIPGLWDMQAHPFLTRQEFFPQFVLNLYVANGVTGLRDMFGPLKEERQWQKGITVERRLSGREQYAHIEEPKTAQTILSHPTSSTT
jgi:hypothetical protein